MFHRFERQKAVSFNCSSQRAVTKALTQYVAQKIDPEKLTFKD